MEIMIEASNANNTNNTNDEPNPPIWSDSVVIYRPPGGSKTNLVRMQQELYDRQDPRIAFGDDTTQQQQTQRTFTCADHFSRRRTALLFAPGIYPNIHFEIGYYVQVLGLGEHASDVQFLRTNDCNNTDHDNNDHDNNTSRFVGPYIPALNKHIHKRGNGNQPVGTSLDSFWRGAENFSITAAATTSTAVVAAKSSAKSDTNTADMLWAASQAASMRRLHISGDLYLHDEDAFASGGHLTNTQVDGTIYMGGQQQYLVRNVRIGTNATGGAWSMVYVGCTGTVPSSEATQTNGLVVTVVDQPRVRVEKPYIVMKHSVNDTEERFELRVPQVKYCNDSSYTTDPLLVPVCKDNEVVRDFTKIRVIRDTEPIVRIQEALDAGKDVILCPGIYILQESVVIRQPSQILFGLGLATLVAPNDGSPCICVAHNNPGVRIAGLMLEATEFDSVTDVEKAELVKESSALLVWGDIERGDDTNDTENRENPGAMFDIYIRVGGASSTKTEKSDRTKVAVHTMMYIHSDYVIGDNLWLWRADHAELGRNENCNYPNISPIFWQTESNEYRVQHGLVVTGHDVTIFGLAVEHTNSHQTIWSGERGAVYFYQCELPYDCMGTSPDGSSDSNSKPTLDICAFYISPNVREHSLYAPGIYSNFRNAEIYASTGIRHPNHPLVTIKNPFIVKLDNLGGIQSVINGKGKGTDRQGIPVRLEV